MSISSSVVGRISLLCSLLSFTGPCFAQNVQVFPPTAASHASADSDPDRPRDFSKEAVVYEKLNASVREEEDGSGTRQISARIRVQSDAGVKQLAILAFPYSSSNQQIDFAYVRVIKPDGTVVTTPDYNVQDLPADVTREAPMYSDLHQKHVAVRGLGVGDILEYQVTLRTTKPDIPGQFWFDYDFEKNAIVLEQQLDLDVPASKQVTVVSAGVQPTITEQGARKLYHWASSNLSHPNPDAPAKSTRVWKPAIEVTTFATWEQVGAWYASLEKDSVVVTPAIQAHVADLTKGLTSDDAKIHAIFNDVALHIHYVALEFGIGRYQPHPADDVLANEYGDCKDKHTLLAAMLKAAGIDSWPVLISSSHALDPNTPSPGQFDHVITVVPSNGHLVWMDSTEEVSPVGMLAGSLRDKQALAVPTDKPAYIERTPADLPKPRSIQFHIIGTLAENGLFTAKVDETADEDAGAELRMAFRKVPQDKWKDLLHLIQQAQGFNGEESDIQVSDVDKIDEPLRISFKYRREGYDQWQMGQPSHWIGPPLPPMGGELVSGMKVTKPADDYQFGGIGQTVYNAEVFLPVGWSMTAPKNVNVVKNWAEYHSTYSFTKGEFITERRVKITADKVSLDQWNDIVQFRRSMGDDLTTQVRIMPGGR